MTEPNTERNICPTCCAMGYRYNGNCPNCDDIKSGDNRTTADIPVADLLKWSDQCAPLPKWYRRRGPCEPS